jgi:oligopeptide/dipeptide ABC transporter ATP-binding protein
MEPRVLICDESVSALDVSVQAQILNLLQDLQCTNNLSIVFISHDLSVVWHMADRIAVMYLGQVVELGPAKTVFGNPQHPYTQALLSSAPNEASDVDHKRQRIVLSGEVPSPIHPPSGCKFHTRCWKAVPACSSVVPDFTDVGLESHMAACHLLESQTK